MVAERTSGNISLSSLRTTFIAGSDFPRVLSIMLSRSFLVHPLYQTKTYHIIQRIVPLVMMIETGVFLMS